MSKNVASPAPQILLFIGSVDSTEEFRSQALKAFPADRFTVVTATSLQDAMGFLCDDKQPIAAVVAGPLPEVADPAATFRIDTANASEKISRFMRTGETGVQSLDRQAKHTLGAGYDHRVAELQEVPVIWNAPAKDKGEGVTGRGRKGGTLVEVLVVTAIIGTLAALLLPAVQAGRQAARRINDASSGKNIGLAILGATDRQGYFPLSSRAYESPKIKAGVRLSPWAPIMPEFEAANQANKYNDDQWYFDAASSTNLEVSKEVPLILQLTSLPNSRSFPGQSDWSLMAGTDPAKSSDLTYASFGHGQWIRGADMPSPLNGIGQVDRRQTAFERDEPFPKVTPASVTDGLSNTIMAAANKNAPASQGYIGTNDSVVAYWTTPGYGLVTTAGAGPRESGDTVKTGADTHEMALDAPVVYGDGHVDFVRKEINREVLKARATRAGGEIPSRD